MAIINSNTAVPNLFQTSDHMEIKPNAKEPWVKKVEFLDNIIF